MAVWVASDRVDEASWSRVIEGNFLLRAVLSFLLILSHIIILDQPSVVDLRTPLSRHSAPAVAPATALGVVIAETMVQALDL